MKPPPFDYVAASSIDEALHHLSQAGDDALVIAGGQTLMPLLALRLSAPGILIDINNIEDLNGIERISKGTRIKAVTRQVKLLTDSIVAEHVPLLEKATRHVGHYQTRNRGTVGGSIALGEPAAELPAVAVALDAKIELRSASGQREITASDFYEEPYVTAINPDEMVTSILFPDWGAGTHTVITEIARRPGDFALVGLICAAKVDGDRISRCAISWFGMGPTPIRSREAEENLTGQRVSNIDFSEIAQLAISETEPTDDTHATGAYRRIVGKRIFGRTLKEALNIEGNV